MFDLNGDKLTKTCFGGTKWAPEPILINGMTWVGPIAENKQLIGDVSPLAVISPY